MHQRVRGVVGPERLEHPVAGHRGGQRQGAAGQRLGQRDDVGPDARLFEGEHGPGTPEAGEDLVKDQQQAVLVRQVAQAAQHFRVMQQHAARALHQRLDKNARQLRRARLQELIQGGVGGVVARQVHDVVLGQHAPVQAVHAVVGVAHGHGAERIAVIAAPKRYKAAAAALALVQPELHRHFHGDFYRHRPGVGVEDAVQPRPQQAGQAARERQRGLVGQAAEHHMRHGIQLRAHGLGDVRVVVTVASRPPGRHAIDQAAPVRQFQPAAVAAHHGQRRRHRFHLGIGKPDMRLALGHPVGRVHG
ncbi:hypothetical protein D3C72_1371560 [compost metagenome]